MDKLKPCPFCGGKAITERWASGGIMYMVKCGNPDCVVPAEGYPSGRNLTAVTDHWNSIKAGWNNCIDAITGGNADD